MLADELNTKEDWIYAEAHIGEFEVDDIISLLKAGVSPESLDMDALEEEGLADLVLPFIDMG